MRWVPLLLLLAGCGPRVLFRGEEPVFGAVFVVQQGSQRALRFGHPDAEDQSIYDLARPDHEPLGYVRTALLALAHAGHPRRLLMIGLGGGSYLRHVRRLAPDMALEAVEINPLVVQVCRRYFTLPRGTVVRVEDGRRFVQQAGSKHQRYDVVFIDAYDAVDYPLHLGTRQFFAEVARILAPGGVVVANLSPNTDRTRDNLARTFLHVFPVAICLTAGSGNTVLLGRRGPGPTGPEVVARIRRLEQKSHGRYGLIGAARRRCVLDLHDARLLQD